MFDTHCHLNFKAFSGKVDEIIIHAVQTGVNYFVVPGTDIETSKKAVEIAEKYPNVFAAVGIHPHHLFNLHSNVILGSPDGRRDDSRIDSGQVRMTNSLNELEKLITHPKVVAVGEVGLDKHIYKKTVYQVYQVDQDFIELQKEFFLEQIKLASKYKKALIIHNREAKKDLLTLLIGNQSLITENRLVFHCCEPDKDLLDFAVKYNIFIGVDGDVTYWKEKQDFVKTIPLKQLVLETDSPFLSPLRKFPNEPKNLNLIVDFIALQMNISKEQLIRTTEENSKKLFLIA